MYGMQYIQQTIVGIDGSEARFFGYVADNSEEMEPDRIRPAILILPGGGYAMTSDREAEPVALQFLAKGFAVFVLRYSVQPSRYPVALLEAAEAMRLIRANADQWHVNPAQVAVLGFSAGGHLAANLATSVGDEDIREQGGMDPDAVRPNALMLSYPSNHRRQVRPSRQLPMPARGPSSQSGFAGQVLHRKAHRCQNATRLRLAYHDRRRRARGEHANAHPGLPGRRREH